MKNTKISFLGFSPRKLSWCGSLNELPLTSLGFFFLKFLTDCHSKLLFPTTSSLFHSFLFWTYGTNIPTLKKNSEKKSTSRKTMATLRKALFFEFFSFHPFDFVDDVIMSHYDIIRDCLFLRRGFGRLSLSLPLFLMTSYVVITTDFYFHYRFLSFHKVLNFL